MKLLPAARLRVRLRPAGSRLATAAYALTLVGLELSGPNSPSDLHDLPAAFLLLFATLLLLAQHRRHPIPWVGWLLARGRRGFKRLVRRRYQLGTDLRGSPVLPDRLPAPVWGLVGGLAGLAGLAGLLWATLPGGWRTLGVRGLYTPYLVVLLGVWAALLGLAAAGLAVPVLALDRRLRGTLRAADRRPAVTLGLLGYVLLVAAASVLLPLSVVLGLVLAVAAAGFGSAARVPAGRPGLLWRAGPAGAVHSVPARRLAGTAVGLLGVGVFALLVVACGGRLVQPPGATGPMVVTAQLGGLAAWLLPGLVGVLAAELLVRRDRDPARRTPPTLLVHPNGRPAADVVRAVRAVRRWGWRAEVADAVRPGEVGVALVAPERSQATEFDPGWPLAVSVDDLEAGAVRERLARRDEVQLRRQAFRGLAVLLKRASRGPSGGGVWFAPHWWLNAGLMRDRPAGSKPGPPRRVGPPFASVYPPRVIQHLHAVLRAVEIDLIYLEDGVTRKQFDRVLRAVFELYDVHGGQRPADDRHFLGLPRVKVLVHSYAPGEPPRKGAFRQPKFDDLTRARVLHVFREDDGVPADEAAPFDTSWEPSPALGLG